MMPDINEILYPPIEPYNSGFLQVSSVHNIYYEECGKENGLPVVYLHGGPGSGSKPEVRRFFDPEAYRIVVFDQRGAGKSTPAFSLEENDTWSLVADMEKLRVHLGIEKWVVFGGSWGSTLALVYAEKHIERVLALVLRGIFLGRREENDWLMKKGASYLFPEFWDEFLAPIPEDERHDMFSAYHKRLHEDNTKECVRYAHAYTKWETVASQFGVKSENLSVCLPEEEQAMLFKARLEFHYFSNGCFFPSPNYILDHVHIIRDKEIPVTIVQGRYDTVCPGKTAWELYRKLPQAEIYFIEDGGHSTKVVGMTKKLVEACDKYKVLLSN